MKDSKTNNTHTQRIPKGKFNTAWKLFRRQEWAGSELVPPVTQRPEEMKVLPAASGEMREARHLKSGENTLRREDRLKELLVPFTC